MHHFLKLTDRLTGALNRHLNIDRNYELTPFLKGARLHQPAVLMAGETDTGIVMYFGAFENLEKNAPNVQKKILLQSAGHWIQQEPATEITEILIAFAKEL